MKTEYRNIPFTIVMQGAPVITDLNAVVFVESDNIMCLDVDLDSKWCELVGTGGGDGGIEVYVDGTGRTYHPESGPGGHGMTGIRFELPDWNMYCAECSRYTLRVVLYKEKL
jgi:hypothetical protein